MNIDLGQEALEYGRVAIQAIGSAGGDQLVQTAEAQPERRASLVEPVLGELGAWDLDPRAGSDELEAAAALSRSAGFWGLDYPLAERLCRPADGSADGTIIVSGDRPAGRVGSLDLTWCALDIDGHRSTVSARPMVAPARKTSFVVDLDLDPAGDGERLDVCLGLILPCWTLLGMLDRALQLTCAYVKEREQFGQPLASFQGVQFQLTDAEVERIGFEELAKYALWSTGSGRPEALEDVLAARAAGVEAADVVFRICHQLHGAIGFCDETFLSWLSRYSLPLRHLPLGLSATREALTRRIGDTGLSGIFGPN